MNAIPGFDGYFATEDGRIVSMRSGAPVELRQRIRRGYWVVTLHIRMRGQVQARSRHVHQMVLPAFKGEAPGPKYMVRHLDGDSLNNDVSNLAWGTAKDNAEDAVRHGTIGPGMKARRRRLDDAQVRQIRDRFAAGESDALLATEYGVSAGYPSKLARRICWAHLDDVGRG